MSNVQCRNDESRVEQIRVVDSGVVVRWYSEAHLRVFDRGLTKEMIIELS